MIGLSACGGTERTTPTDNDPGAGPSPNPIIVADFVKSHGEDFEQCFSGRPVMAAPGTIVQAPGAGSARSAKVASLIIAIDGSGSMAAMAGGESKMDAAKRAATQFLAGVPAGVHIGLLAFGHQGSNRPEGKAKSCSAVETVYPLGQASAAQVNRALERIKATGWTPLASAIATAGKSFPPGGPAGAQVVYVVSDGLETCGGDPVAAARALNAGPVKAIVNIIGFDLNASDRAQLKSVASAGGGAFVEAGSASALSDALADLFRKAGSVSAITTERFDAGGRTAANSMAAGRYTTKLNLCVAHAASAEASRLPQFLDGAGVRTEEREPAREALVARHEHYRARSQKVADEVAAEAGAANAAIAAQTQASEIRLGVDRKP
jgi:Ca-activated chloride channel family protein